MTTERNAARKLIADARAFAARSLEWEWRLRAAWKLEQSARGIPADFWTNEPPGGFDAALERMNHAT